MKVIKFRCWHPDQAEMHYFYNFVDVVKFQTGEELEHYDEYRSENNGSNYLGTRCVTFMQYTGHTDISGKEIYGGDILQTGRGYVVIKEFKTEFLPQDLKKKSVNWKSVVNGVIVGNIFDNNIGITQEDLE